MSLFEGGRVSGEAVVDELISELRASAAAGAMFEGEDMAQVGLRLLYSPAGDLFAVGGTFNAPTVAVCQWPGLTQPPRPECICIHCLVTDKVEGLSIHFLPGAAARQQGLISQSLNNPVSTAMYQPLACCVVVLTHTCLPPRLLDVSAADEGD